MIIIFLFIMIIILNITLLIIMVIILLKKTILYRNRCFVTFCENSLLLKFWLLAMLVVCDLSRSLVVQCTHAQRWVASQVGCAVVQIIKLVLLAIFWLFSYFGFNLGCAVGTCRDVLPGGLCCGADIKLMLLLIFWLFGCFGLVVSYFCPSFGLCNVHMHR